MQRRLKISPKNKNGGRKTRRAWFRNIVNGGEDNGKR